jgi:hypothetical protein
MSSASTASETVARAKTLRTKHQTAPVPYTSNMSRRNAERTPRTNTDTSSTAATPTHGNLQTGNPSTTRISGTQKAQRLATAPPGPWVPPYRRSREPETCGRLSSPRPSSRTRSTRPESGTRRRTSNPRPTSRARSAQPTRSVSPSQRSVMGTATPLRQQTILGSLARRSSWSTPAWSTPLSRPTSPTQGGWDK